MSSEIKCEKDVLYSVLFEEKALYSVILPVDDIEIAPPVEGQTSGTLKLISFLTQPVSTHPHPPSLTLTLTLSPRQLSYFFDFGDVWLLDFRAVVVREKVAPLFIYVIK